MIQHIGPLLQKDKELTPFIGTMATPSTLMHSASFSMIRNQEEADQH
jgi:hypothetical protein